ncbi:Ig-like domain-containing protein [Alloalcanivorax xenomutans]|uniref:Ig-like domain-containing protein n=1 Tax=Alloalcanivorax xenomutans TaxID=1094342 RepID=UPI002931EF77|nr:Ig-like domain-containing protein [Alloalcanivorax xenomutans]WOA29741.1 Ig-like domain-containing protein [Alloalcanivorax xenomutans]
MIRGTFNRTLYGTLLITACATVLTACGGSDGSSMPGNDANDAQRQSLLYAYPDDGQSEVAIPAPVVLRFSSDIELAAAENNIKLRLGGADGDIVPVTYSKVEADGRSILLTPTEKLQPLTDYTVTLRGVQLSVGKAPNRDIHFTTRALQRGPKSLVVADDDFTLTRAIPSGDVEEPVMDFSTFRFQFTQPIDPTSARYGLNPGDGTTPADTVALVDSSGELVEARLLTEGPYMTLDPAPEHLTPGETYTLTLGDGLASTFGNTFGGHELTVTPQDSSPRGEPAILVQRITDSENRTRTSPLTGKPVNEVPVNATLLGQDNVTQASGDVRAELGDVTVYPDVTPVRIPADTILSGTSLDVLIGGEVPAGFESGEVKMHFLSDATGYLVPNPYDTHNRADALRIVRLFMDVAITTDEARANGGFTQDMLHIELIGVGEVDPQEGVLKIDAVSVVEPDVLGQEFAHGMLSFQLESYKDQLNAPAPVPDTTPLEFQSWTLGVDGQTGLDKTAMFKPTDPIVLNFTRPLDRQSVTGKVHLYKNEGGVQTEVDSKVTVDGAAIVIKPVDPLEHPTETGPSLSYQVSLDPGIMDLRGEPWVGSFDEMFELGMLVEKRERLEAKVCAWNDPECQQLPLPLLHTGDFVPTVTRSPYITGLYPGFPCVLEKGTTDLASEILGRCAGGLSDNQSIVEPDEMMPLPNNPANRPIIVIFSKPINKDQIIENGNSFIVERVDTHGNQLEVVKGELKVKNDSLYFYPETPWLNKAYYRYTLISNGGYERNPDGSLLLIGGSPVVNPIDCATMICDMEGNPLQTQFLTPKTLIREENSHLTSILDYYILTEPAIPPSGGGPNLSQYFMGAPASDNVLQVLRTSPVSDQNANLIADISWPEIAEQNHEDGFNSWLLAPPYHYENEEKGHTSEPDPNTQNLRDIGGFRLDPDGVKGQPNTVKILPSSYGGKSLDQIPEEVIFDSGVSQQVLQGANIGCGFKKKHVMEDQTRCADQATWGSLTCYYASPVTCPENKFSFLSSTLFAEVTKHSSSNGIRVNVYPGHVIGTSFYMVLNNQLLESRTVVSASGPQVMRLRYSNEDSAGKKMPYLEGYISSDTAGAPRFELAVDMYLDAPELVDEVTRAGIAQRVAHNLHSYVLPEMRMTGPIIFLDDGRMLIDQENNDSISINIRAVDPTLWQDVFIPEKGSFLRYITTPIK